MLIGAVGYNAAAFGVIPYLSLWLQTVLGMSPVRGSLVLLPQGGDVRSWWRWSAGGSCTAWRRA